MHEIKQHRLDKQHRLTIPKKIRDQWALEPDFNGQLAVYPQRSALVVCKIDEFCLLEEKLIATRDPAVRNQARYILGHASECRLDQKGRIRLPDFLLELLALSEEKVWLIIRENRIDICSDNLAAHCLKNQDTIPEERVLGLYYYEKIIRSKLDKIIRLHETAETGIVEAEFQSALYHTRLELLAVLNKDATIQYLLLLHRKNSTEGLHIFIDKANHTAVIRDIENFIGITKKTASTVSSMLHTVRIKNNTDRISVEVLPLEMTHTNTHLLYKSIASISEKQTAKAMSAICYYHFLKDEIHYEIDALMARTSTELSREYAKILQRNRQGMAQILSYITENPPKMDEEKNAYTDRLKKLTENYRKQSRDELALTQDEAYAASWNSGARSAENMILGLTRIS